MNEEIANFFVKFTTEGLVDIKTGIEQINENLDDMNKAFEKSKKGGDSFFGSLVKWTGLIGGLTAAFVTLRNTIRGVFDTAYAVSDLYGQEQILGVSANVLEQYGLIAERNRGSQSDAYSFFGNVNDLMGRFQTGRITKEDTYRFSKLGLAFDYNRDLSLSENRDVYLNALRSAVSGVNKNDADKMAIVSELIGPQSLQRFFMSNPAQAEKQLAWADKLRVLSRNESDLQSAQDLITVQMEWRQTIKHFEIELMPILSKVMKALEPLIPVIDKQITRLGEWVDRHADDMAKWVQDGVDWLIHQFPEILSDIFTTLKALLGAVTPIVEWVVNRLGGTFKSMWDGAKAIWGDITGAEDKEQRWADFNAKYLSDGSTKGGLFGDWLRWVDKWMFMPASKSSVVNNNGANYTIKGDSYFPNDVRLGANGPIGALTAHYSTSKR